MYLRSQNRLLGKVRLFHEDRHESYLKESKCYIEKGSTIPYWVLMNPSDGGVLSGTRNKSYQEQLVHQRVSYPEYQIGTAKELVQ